MPSGERWRGSGDGGAYLEAGMGDELLADAEAILRWDQWVDDYGRVSIAEPAIRLARAYLAEHPVVGGEAARRLAEAGRLTPLWVRMRRQSAERDGEADLAAALAEVERLSERLAAIKTSWQDGVGELNNPWRVRMAELIGDSEGLAELAALGIPPAEGQATSVSVK